MENQAQQQPQVQEKPKKPILKKWWIWVIIIFVIILIVIIVLASKNELEQGENKLTVPTNNQVGNINLTLDAQLNNDILQVFGTANLPDGALVSYEISHEKFSVDFFKEGTIEVQNGKYEFSINVKKWPSGNIKVWVGFQTILGAEKQPQKVIDSYGEMGEKIPDPSAIELGGSFKRVEKELTVLKP